MARASIRPPTEPQRTANRSPTEVGATVQGLRRTRLIAPLVAALVTTVVLVLAVDAVSSPAAAPLLRLELHLPTDAQAKPPPLPLTVGGRMYCVQLEALARNVGASLVCADYGANRYLARGERAGRQMDWGDPA